MLIITPLIVRCDPASPADQPIVWLDYFADGDTEEWEAGDLPGDKFLSQKFFISLIVVKVPVRQCCHQVTSY